MKAAIFRLFLFGLCGEMAVANELPEKCDPFKGYYFYMNRSNDCESLFLSSLQSEVWRSGLILSMKGLNGEVVELTSDGGDWDGWAKPDGTPYKAYELGGWTKNVDYFIVKTYFYEGFEYLIFSREIGKLFKFDGLPVFSPDMKLIAEAVDGIFGNGPILNIWKIENGELIKVNTSMVNIPDFTIEWQDSLSVGIVDWTKSSRPIVDLVIAH